SQRHSPSAHRRAGSRRPMARLRVEELEGRIALNNRFVVPAGFADGVTNFATLSAALSTNGLVAGDIIQIEPGSNPGDVATNPAAAQVSNLTIQGDPAAGLTAIPGFTISGAFNVAGGQTGFALKGVNVRLIGSGAFGLTSSVTIAGARIEADGTAAA